MANSPQPWEVPPDGYHFEALEDVARWIMPPIGAGRCRWGAGPGHPACGKPAVVTLMRDSRPWDYCEEHLYGRWIEDGKVMCWALVKGAADSACAGGGSPTKEPT